MIRGGFLHGASGMETISVPICIGSLAAALSARVGSTVDLESNASDVLALIRLVETLDDVLDRLMPVDAVA